MWLILDYVSSFQHFGLKSFAPAKHTGEKFKIKNCLFISIVARWKFSFCRAGAGGMQIWKYCQRMKGKFQ